MHRRFTLVRLLLAVILINTVLITLYVLDTSGSLKTLSDILPGFGEGTKWGNYLFLSFLFVINAVMVLGTGFAVVIPALLDRLSISPNRLKDVLTNRAGVSGSACEAVVAAVRDEQEVERQQLLAGRWVFRIGALFFIIAFPALCFTYAHADENGTPLFVRAGTHEAVPNGSIEFNDVMSYVGDQALGAVALDAPEIYEIRFSSLNHSLGNPWLPTVAFLFRAIVGLILVTGILAIYRGAVLKSYTRKPGAAPAKAPEPAGSEPAHAH